MVIHQAAACAALSGFQSSKLPALPMVTERGGNKRRIVDALFSCRLAADRHDVSCELL
jgi:hypothetical protein